MYGCQIIENWLVRFLTTANGSRGGQWITLDAPLEKLPLMVRAGAGLPLSKRITLCRCAEQDDTPRTETVPAERCGHNVAACCLKTMAKAGATRTGNALWVEWEMVCDGATINLKVNARGDYRPAWKALKVSLPAGEKRTLLVNGVEGSEWMR